MQRQTTTREVMYEKNRVIFHCMDRSCQPHRLLNHVGRGDKPLNFADRFPLCLHLVNHGGPGADMDANIQREFLSRGVAVKAGADEGDHGNAELIVRYADDWKWDLKMYLWSLDLMVYDARSGTRIGTGRWKNSTLHGFYSSEKVVTDVVHDTLVKEPIFVRNRTAQGKKEERWTQVTR
jgi:hypothetical protein